MRIILPASDLTFCNNQMSTLTAWDYILNPSYEVEYFVSSVEHSLLMPDDGNIVRVQEIDVMRIDDYARLEGLKRLDFVKIEAEGVELEVFEGLGSLRPRKLAIDVSPERNGQSPAEDFWAIMVKLGYEIKQRRNVLFARLPT